MNRKSSSNIDSITTTVEEEISIITLLPCDNDLCEEDDYTNLSQNSIDSSELVDDSDDEAELITNFIRIHKKLNKIDEKNDEITTA